MRSALAALNAFLISFALVAAVPYPGQHSAHPKYWASVHRWVTNYSPYDFSGWINALASDDADGVWFGVSNTLEHIDAAGRMSQYIMPEYLWEIYGFTRDASGRLWFSLGQSGRIGTIDAHGVLRTRIVVPRRYYPDLRDVAFDSDGTLWFIDAGRGSVGMLASDGTMREQPVGDVYSTHLVLRRNRPYLAYYTYSSGDLSAQMQLLSKETLQGTGKMLPLQLGPAWLNRIPIGNTAVIAAVVTSRNGDVWLALNYGNMARAVTRLSLHP